MTAGLGIGVPQIRLVLVLPDRERSESPAAVRRVLQAAGSDTAARQCSFGWRTSGPISTATTVRAREQDRRRALVVGVLLVHNTGPMLTRGACASAQATRRNRPSPLVSPRRCRSDRGRSRLGVRQSDASGSKAGSAPNAPCAGGNSGRHSTIVTARLLSSSSTRTWSRG